MNILVKINNFEIDIDEQTSFAITKQSYDIKDPANRKIDVSNNFTIPKTIRNLKALGLVGGLQSIDNTIYNSLSIEIIIGNEIYFEGGRCFVDNKAERIGIVANKRADFWDVLKQADWFNFEVNGLFPYLVQNDPYFKDINSRFIGNVREFLNPFINAQPNSSEYSNNLILPFFYGGTSDADNNIYLSGNGHFCVYLSTIFKVLEQNNTEIRFLTSGGYVDKNIFDDDYFKQCYVPVRFFEIDSLVNSQGQTECYFKINQTNNLNTDYRKDKTVYDFLKLVFQRFNIVIDDFIINNENVIALRRFDDIKDYAPIFDFSGMFTDNIVFKPHVENIEQNQYIKYKTVASTLNQFADAKKIICENYNLNFDTQKVLFEVNEYLPNISEFDNNFILNLNNEESFKNFNILISNGFINAISYVSIDNLDNTGEILTPVAAVYSLQSEYNFYNEILNKPRFFEVEKWLTWTQIRRIKYFAQYWIEELGASFYINKISEFNPRADAPTKLELIQTSITKPIDENLISYFVDGNDNIFTDGQGNYFY